MNPILLKPHSDRTSQVIVMGRPWATLDAAAYQAAKPALFDLVREQLDDLRRRFDVVICEGAGSPTEINLLDGDLVNLRLAHAAAIPAVVVGDIDRGGVFAALYGTVALLPDELRPTVQGFLINKFRGDPSLLADGPRQLEARCGVPTLGVLPWLGGLGLDAEDSLGLAQGWSRTDDIEDIDHTATPSLDVAVIRLPHISNFTDVDALACEPGVALRLVQSAAALGLPDLVVLPGTKMTIADLEWLRRRDLARAITDLPAGTTILGICGGYQMLGRSIEDEVESRAPTTTNGLGLLAVDTVFHPEKVTRWSAGTALGQPVTGYEIRHGRTKPDHGWCHDANGRVHGTSWHGVLEADAFRQTFLAEVAARAGRTWAAGNASYEDVRQRRFDHLADALAAHADMAAIEKLIMAGA